MEKFDISNLDSSTLLLLDSMAKIVLPDLNDQRKEHFVNELLGREFRPYLVGMYRSSLYFGALLGAPENEIRKYINQLNQKVLGDPDVSVGVDHFFIWLAGIDFTDAMVIENLAEELLSFEGLFVSLFSIMSSSNSTEEVGSNTVFPPEKSPFISMVMYLTFNYESEKQKRYFSDNVIADDVFKIIEIVVTNFIGLVNSNDSKVVDKARRIQGYIDSRITKFEVPVKLWVSMLIDNKVSNVRLDETLFSKTATYSGKYRLQIRKKNLGFDRVDDENIFLSKKQNKILKSLFRQQFLLLGEWLRIVLISPLESWMKDDNSNKLSMDELNSYLDEDKLSDFLGTFLSRLFKGIDDLNEDDIVRVVNDLMCIDKGAKGAGCPNCNSLDIETEGDSIHICKGNTEIDSLEKIKFSTINGEVTRQVLFKEQYKTLLLDVDYSCLKCDYKWIIRTDPKKILYKKEYSPLQE